MVGGTGKIVERGRKEEYGESDRILARGGISGSPVKSVFFWFYWKNPLTLGA